MGSVLHLPGLPEPRRRPGVLVVHSIVEREPSDLIELPHMDEAHEKVPPFVLPPNSDLLAAEAAYTVEERCDHAFVLGELFWYRDAFDRLNLSELARLGAEQEADMRRRDPVLAERWFGPASTAVPVTPTSPATASPARRAAAPRHKRGPWSAGAHPFNRLRAWLVRGPAPERA